MEILSLGEKIRNRRKELNMTLKDLAGDRVTAGQLSFVELGKSNPSTELLEYIAERLQVSVDYLLESEASQAKKICEYNIKMAQAYIYDGKNEDAGELLDRSYDMASRYDLGDLLGMIELDRGRIALNENRYEAAARCFLKANKYFIENRYYTGAIDTYMLMGETAYKKGFYELSLSYFNQAGQLYDESGLYDEQLKAKIYFKICLCHINLNRQSEVDKYLKYVEEYLNSMNDKSEYAHKLMAVSLTYRDAGDYKKALSYADIAVSLFKELEDRECLAKMEMNMGFIYSEKGDLDKSDYYLEDCQKSINRNNIADIARIFLKSAYNNVKRNMLDQAEEYIEKSFKLAVESEDIDCQIECYCLLGNIYMLRKDYLRCEEALKSRMSLLESINRPAELMKCYIEAGEYYRFMGDNKHETEYMNKGYKLLTQINEHLSLK